MKVQRNGIAPAPPLSPKGERQEPAINFNDREALEHYRHQVLWEAFSQLNKKPDQLFNPSAAIQYLDQCDPLPETEGEEGEFKIELRARFPGLSEAELSKMARPPGGIPPIAKPDKWVNTVSEIDGNPLMSACYYGHIKAVQKYIKKHSRPPAVREHMVRRPRSPYAYEKDVGRGIIPGKKNRAPCHTTPYIASPLSLAALKGHVEIAKLLLQTGAYKSEKEMVQRALVAAMEQGHSEMIDLLIESGAKVDQIKEINPLACAISTGNLELVDQILDSGPDFRREYLGFTPLGWAIGQKRFDLAKDLIARGANEKQAKPSQRGAMAWACYWGASEVIEALLNHGSAPNLHFRYSSGTPLLFAVLSGSIESVKCLVQAAKKDRSQRTLKEMFAGTEGWRSPFSGAFRGERQLDFILYAMGKSGWAYEDSDKFPAPCLWTTDPLLLAARSKDKEIFDYLWECRPELSFPVDFARAKASGSLARVQAVLREREESSSSKLHLPRPSCLTRLDRVGEKAFTAMRQGTPKKSFFGEVAPSLICELIKDHAVKYPTEDSLRYRMLEAALDAGLLRDPKKHGVDWGLPVSCATYWGKHEMLQLLLERGANPNVPFDSYTNPWSSWAHGLRGRTYWQPGRAAVEKGDVKSLRILLNAGLDVDAVYLARGDARFPKPANQPNTLLNRAIAKGNVKIVKLLLERGARTHGKLSGKLKWDAMQTAWQGKNEKIRRLLLEEGVTRSQQGLDGALAVSSAEGELFEVELLISRGAKIKNIDVFYKAATAAIENKQAEVLRLLLEAGPDLYSARGKKSLAKCMKLAKAVGDPDLIGLLVKKG